MQAKKRIMNPPVADAHASTVRRPAEPTIWIVGGPNSARKAATKSGGGQIEESKPQVSRVATVAENTTPKPVPVFPRKWLVQVTRSVRVKRGPNDQVRDLSQRTSHVVPSPAQLGLAESAHAALPLNNDKLPTAQQLGAPNQPSCSDASTSVGGAVATDPFLGIKIGQQLELDFTEQGASQSVGSDRRPERTAPKSGKVARKTKRPTQRIDSGAQGNLGGIEAVPFGSKTLLRKLLVQKKTGLTNSAMYVAMRKGLFPRSIPLVEGGRAVGWDLAEIDRWIDERIAKGKSRISEG